MAGQQKIKKNDLGFLEQARLLTREEFTAMVGLTFVALGLVFVLGQANMLDYSSPWWTLFIGIPGLVFLVASALTIRQQGNLTAMAVAQAGDRHDNHSAGAQLHSGSNMEFYTELDTF